MINDAAAADGDPCTVWMGFLRTHFTDDLGVLYLAATVVWYVLVEFCLECLSTCNAVLFRTHGTSTNALAQASQLIAVRLLPYLFVLGIASELAVLQDLACFCIKDWDCKVGHIGCPERYQSFKEVALGGL